MADSVMIRGSILAVLFQNEENGYTVLRFQCEDGNICTVVGTIPDSIVGEQLKITGSWETHPSHGRQFRAEVLERLLPTGAAAIERYLASRSVKGIGPKLASRIVTFFGDDTLRIMESQPERLAEVPGITPQKAQTIGLNYQKQFGMRKILEYLISQELPAEAGVLLYRAYGDLAIEALQDDPYLLADSFFGVDFSRVDAFAVRNGIAAEDPRRLSAAVLSVLRHNLGNGHVFIPCAKLCEATAAMLSVDVVAVEDSLKDMHVSGQVVLDTLRNMELCYLPEYFEAESYIDLRIRSMLSDVPYTPGNLDKLIFSAESASGTELAPAQRAALRTAAENSVMILTGGPGTGKTTTVNAILELFDLLGLKTALAAPTGRAAKRMSELCGREAATIHRLLESQYSADDNSLIFLHDESEPLRADAVIIDETSMVDLLLMEALLRALKPGCRLILVGDPDQLPSVGAGNVFSDMIRSKVIPVACLTEIFRQARESLIVMNAHAINHGEQPDLSVKNKDFFMLRKPDITQAVDTIVDLCVRRLPQNMGIPADQIQVLTPTRKNLAGTEALNARLQEAINPPSPEKQERKYGKTVFREGDRVMQIKNNYDIMWTRLDHHGFGSGVFNGDVGTIHSIVPEEEVLTVLYDDKLVEYSFDLLGQLELAYAMTVHKSQGSEYRAVILSVSKANSYLLTRSILYTAVTRARELLILVGDTRVVDYMVNNNLQSRRYSGLKLRLQRGDPAT